jgi:hypothetical protein
MHQYAERFGPFCLDGNYFPRFPSISPYGFFTGYSITMTAFYSFPAMTFILC